MNRPFFGRHFASLRTLSCVAGIALAFAGCDESDSSEEPTCEEAPDSCVTLSGTAYKFSEWEILLEGARIGIHEQPDVETFTDENGNWSLEVRAGGLVTPYIEAAGYVDMTVQTFEATEDIDHVFFQSVTPSTYAGMEAILGIDTDEERCHIVTTVSEIAVQGLDHADFIAHGAHGVADATVELEPSVEGIEAIYFNEDVLPDASRTESSRDGGVVWTNVPPGVYRLRVSHPTLDFAEPLVTCMPGIFVNANPPQGAHQLP